MHKPLLYFCDAENHIIIIKNPDPVRCLPLTKEYIMRVDYNMPF